MSETPEKYPVSEIEHVPDDRRATVDEQTHHPKNWVNFRVISNAVILGLALGLWGYDNAFVSPLVSLPLFVLKFQGPGVEGLLAFTAENLILLVTIPLIGAALGSFASVPLQNRLGRKGTVLSAYFFCCMPGSLLQLFAPNLGALVAGRVWNYVGISVLTNVAPLWLSEIMPPTYRGRAVGFAVAGLGIVSILATLIVWGTEQIADNRQWQIPLAIQVACPVALFLLTLFTTESPVWYLTKGRGEEARKSLLSLRNHNHALVEAELAIQALALQKTEDVQTKVDWRLIFNKANIERTLMSGFPASAGQASGAALVGTFATVLLVQSGVTNPFEVTVIIAVAQFVGFCVAPYLYDRIGRRPVALTVYGLVVIFTAILGGLAFTGLLTAAQDHAFAALSVLMAFILAVINGLTFLVPAEVPTASLREPTITWTTFWSYATAVVTTFAIPEITSAGAGDLGAKAYFIFMGTTIVIWVIIYFYLPETAGRTLAEIDELYAAGIPKRKWSGYVTSKTEAAAAHEMEVMEHEEPVSV